MSLPTFYIPPSRITGKTALLTGDELRHARLTLRLGVGDAVRIVDGEGSSWDASFQTMGRTEGSLKLGTRETEPFPDFTLDIAMGIVQGDRFDWAIQKTTELGASGFIPLLTERTEVKVEGNWKKAGRLQRVIASACKQCGRARFPTIFPPVSIEEMDTDHHDLMVVFWEEGTAISLRETAEKIDPPGSCLMVIGPVGGLTGKEVDHLRKKGAIVAGLGPRILRTETAVTAGAALLQFMWGDMG